MKVLKLSLVASLCLLTTTATAAPPLSNAERYARRCKSQAPERSGLPQGTMLWGMKPPVSGKATLN